MMTEITPLERLIKSIHRDKVDRPPCICPGGMMNMIVEDIMDLTGQSWPEAHMNGELMADLASGHYENGGFENYGVPFCMTVEAQSMGASVAMGDRIHEPRVTAYPMEKLEDWRSLHSIDPDRGRAKEVCRAIEILRARNPEVPVIANLTGPISLAGSLIEPSVLYKDMRKNSEEVTKFLSFVSSELVRFGREQLKAGADILTISDPSGTGEILGPKMFRTFALPALNNVLEPLRPLAKGTIVHICGRLASVASVLEDLSCDCISFDSITAVKDISSKISNKAFMGNVSTLAIETSSREHLRKSCDSCLDNGVNVLSPACGIGAMTKMDQIRTMIESVKDRAKDA